MNRKSRACRTDAKNTRKRADMSSELGTGPISMSTAGHWARSIWDFGLPRERIEFELASNRIIGARHYGIPAHQLDAWAEAECLKYLHSWEAANEVQSQ